MKNIQQYISIISLGGLLFTNTIFSQTTGEIRGTITDESKSPLFGAAVQIYSDSIFIGGATANEDGVYTAKNITPGTYNLHFSAIGYQKKIKKDVSVSASQKVNVNVMMKLYTDSLPTVVIEAYEKTPINEGYSPVELITLENLNQGAAPKNDIIGVISNVSSDIMPTNDGKDLYVRGSRRGTTQYIVDGMKTVGGFNVPGGAIANIVVMSGGISAEYGDLTGGVIIVTTKNYMTSMRQKRMMYDEYYEQEEYKQNNLIKKDTEVTEEENTAAPN